jgi:hypothetical protein
MKPFLPAVCLVALIVVPGAVAQLGDPAAGGYQFQSTGFAIRPDNFATGATLNVLIDPSQATPITATADATAPIFRAMFDRHPTPTGEILLRFLVWETGDLSAVEYDAVFVGTDNMVNWIDPTATALPYHAESLTAGYTLRFDGFQFNRFVSGEGEFTDGTNTFRFVVSAHAIGI